MVLFGTNLFQIANSVSVPTFCHFVDNLWLLLQKIHFSKILTNQLFELEFCAVRQDTHYPHQDYEQFIFYKNSSLYFIGWSIRNWKIAADLHLAKN